MCTVTYIPLKKNEFILTSSRDVPYKRERASLPKKYIEDDVELWYPKDGKAGGTWIGVSSKKRLICLLNGAFKNHISKASYKKSRGIIVKELLKENDIMESIKTIDLHNIEEFTLTIVDWNSNLELIEFVWDGHEKHVKILPQESHIWSSSTLYDEAVKEKRRSWFRNWQKQNNSTQKNILEFHHTAGEGDRKTDVLMDRNNGGTVSISSIKLERGKIYFSYEDVLENLRSEFIIKMG